MMLVKTWSESTKEARQYLRYNGYGKVIIRLFKTDYYLCFFRDNMLYIADDIEIIK